MPPVQAPEEIEAGQRLHHRAHGRPRRIEAFCRQLSAQTYSGADRQAMAEHVGRDERQLAQGQSGLSCELVLRGHGQVERLEPPQGGGERGGRACEGVGHVEPTWEAARWP